MKLQLSLYCLLVFLLGCRVITSSAEDLSEVNNSSIHESLFDFEKELISIPDTHENPEPYNWKAEVNPDGYEILADTDSGNFATFNINSPENIEIFELHVFVTPTKLQFANHLIPHRIADNKFSFEYEAPIKGKYRFEALLRTQDGWINLRRNFRLNQSAQNSQQAGIGPEYEVIVKKVPAKIYADHIATLVFEIIHEGKPVTDLQQVEGSEMHLAGWNKSWIVSLKEFNYAVSNQNLGGSEVAVSLVFRTPGKHIIFGEFSHLQKKHIIRYEVNVLLEDRESSKYTSSGN